MKVGAVGFYNLKNRQLNNSNTQSTKIWQNNNALDMPLKTDLIQRLSQRPKISFNARLPFENMPHLKIPCICCGRPMITFKEYNHFLNSWPQNLESFSADYVIKTFEKVMLNPEERRIFNKFQELNKKKPNLKFSELVMGLDVQTRQFKLPKRFKVFADAKQKLTREEFNSRVFKLLGNYEDAMRPVEKDVFTKLKSLHKSNNDKSLQELMLMMRPENLQILETKQISILNEINLLTRGLSPDSAKKIKTLIKETKNVIIDELDEDPFKRKVFLQKLKFLISKSPKTDDFSKILEKASNIPTSQTDSSAFIVKYSGMTTRNSKFNKKIYERRSSKEIGKRLLAPSRETIEHIEPLHPVEGRPRGEDSAKNMGLECGGCNGPRMSTPGYEWVEIHPEMILNSQKQTDIIINHINEGRIKNAEWYPPDLAKTVAREYSNPKTGEVLIQLDTSKLNKTSDMKLEKLGEVYNLRVT